VGKRSAAAATAVVLKKGPRPAAFTANHPFLFPTRDKQSGSILFIGRVPNPKASSSDATVDRVIDPTECSARAIDEADEVLDKPLHREHRHLLSACAEHDDGLVDE